MSLKSDKDKGSFSASVPGAFIQQNTVHFPEGGPYGRLLPSYFFSSVKAVLTDNLSETRVKYFFEVQLQQPARREPCCNFSNKFPATDESLCSMGI